MTVDSQSVVASRRRKLRVMVNWPGWIQENALGNVPQPSGKRGEMTTVRAVKQTEMENKKRNLSGRKESVT